MIDAHIYLQSEMTQPELIELPGGQACVFSARCPGKATRNEDAAAILCTAAGAVMLAVADGMGGESQGEVASRVTIESLHDEFASLAGTEALLRTAIINGIERANTSVQTVTGGAGTTLAAVELTDGMVRPYHIGDSVVLVVGGRGKIKLQTVAHSPVGYGVESGLLDEDDAMHHDDRHVISNFIGTPQMRIDIGSPVKLSRRDTVLLASDGLFDNLHADEIARLIRTGKLSNAVAALATIAQQRMDHADKELPSKPDDLTVVAYRSRVAMS